MTWLDDMFGWWRQQRPSGLRQSRVSKVPMANFRVELPCRVAMRRIIMVDGCGRWKLFSRRKAAVETFSASWSLRVTVRMACWSVHPLPRAQRLARSKVPRYDGTPAAENKGENRGHIVVRYSRREKLSIKYHLQCMSRINDLTTGRTTLIQARRGVRECTVHALQ